VNLPEAAGAVLPLEEGGGVESESNARGNAIWWVIGFGAIAVGVWLLATRFVRGVALCVEQWNPPASANSEAELRDSLARHLRKTLPHAHIVTEHGAERSRVDIAVSDGSSAHAEKVAVELKLALCRKAELDRLVGQVMGYRTLGFRKVMVVLVGASPDLLAVLRSREATPGLSGYMMVLCK